MKTISDYIKYYKDIPFSDVSFNDIDSAIFSSLVYLNFEGIANKDITIGEAGKKFFETFETKSLRTLPIVVKKTVENFKILYDGKRYKDIIITDYVKVVDSKKQFCAMTYKLKDNKIYIAFEGTDESLIGWQEDFELIYKFPVPAQRMAIDYINKHVKFSTRNVIVGGHSKGGNLAMTASMYARSYVKRRISKVYSFDGPGFRKNEYESNEFKALLPKLKSFVPEQSVVGMLLRHPNNYTVIKSTGKGLFQHNINNWCCYGSVFVSGELSDNSKNMEKRIDTWLDRHDDDQRRIFVNTIFNTLYKCEFTKLSELRKLNLKKFIKFIKISRELDKESKELVLSAFKIIFFGDKEINVD